MTDLKNLSFDPMKNGMIKNPFHASVLLVPFKTLGILCRTDLGNPHVSSLPTGADRLRGDEVGIGGLKVVQEGVHVLHRVVLSPCHRMV